MTSLRAYSERHKHVFFRPVFSAWQHVCSLLGPSGIFSFASVFKNWRSRISKAALSCHCKIVRKHHREKKIQVVPGSLPSSAFTMGENSGETLLPLDVCFLWAVSSPERDWQSDNTRCQALLPTQRPFLRCQLLGWALRSTRHLPWGLPGLRDTARRKPSQGVQLLSELGSKAPSVLQKNISQTRSLSPWFEWMLNESPGTPVALLRDRLGNEKSPPFKARLFEHFNSLETHQKWIRKTRQQRNMRIYIFGSLHLCIIIFFLFSWHMTLFLVTFTVPMKDTENIKKPLFNHLGLSMKAWKITINFPELGL